ncbi:MAG: hypothetical protein ACRYFS_09160 [Janthinobacterium lividum]
MNLPQLQAFPKDRVRALFGLEPAALGVLLATALPEMLVRRAKEQQKKPERQRGRRRRTFPQDASLPGSAAHAGLPAP